MEPFHTILSIAAVFQKTVSLKRNKMYLLFKSYEMITSYKESNTEEEFNKKRIKHDHSQKHHTYIY